MAKVQTHQLMPNGDHVYLLTFDSGETRMGTRMEIGPYLQGTPNSRIIFKDVSGKSRGEFRAYARGSI